MCHSARTFFAQRQSETASYQFCQRMYCTQCCCISCCQMSKSIRYVCMEASDVLVTWVVRP